MIIVGCVGIDCVCKTDIICTQETGVEFYDYCDNLFSENNESFVDFMDKHNLEIDNTGYGDYVLVDADMLDLMQITPAYICCAKYLVSYCYRNYPDLDAVVIDRERITRFDVYRALDL